MVRHLMWAKVHRALKSTRFEGGEESRLGRKNIERVPSQTIRYQLHRQARTFLPIPATKNARATENTEVESDDSSPWISNQKGP